MATGLVVYGRDTKFRVYFNNSLWPVVVKSWRIQEQAVEAADGVNGEIRDRLQKITNFFKCTFDCYDDGTTSTLENILFNQENEDAINPDLPFSGGVQFFYRNKAGSRKAFVLGDCSLGPMDINSGGRTSALNHALSFRARFFTAVPAA